MVWPNYMYAAACIEQHLQLVLFIELWQPHYVVHQELVDLMAEFNLPTQSDGNRLVLQQTMTLVERAISLAPSNSLYITEVRTVYRITRMFCEHQTTFFSALQEQYLYDITTLARTQRLDRKVWLIRFHRKISQYYGTHS